MMDKASGSLNAAKLPLRLFLWLFAISTIFPFALLLLTSIKSFDLIFTMTRGGPANATLVPNIYMYQLGFELNRFGYAAAVAIIGAILIFIVNYAIHRFVRAADEGEV